LSSAASLSLGRKKEAFALAREMTHLLPASTPRYDQLVIAYNATRPPGFRKMGLKQPGPTPSKGKTKKKGR